MPQPDGVPLPVGIRYPTDAPATIHAIALLQQQVAENAPVLAGRHALVVMSHGNGGFVVATPTHAGDDTIDAVPTDWSGRDAVDPDAIGLFGFSSGGLTVLVVAGGVPDLARVAPFCAAHASNSACALLRSHPAPLPAADVGTHDPRIRAVVAAAPALAGLERAGTQVGYRDVPGADRWDFLAPCSAALAKAAPVIRGERDGFDRAAFHAGFDAAVVAFFRRTLAAP